MEGLKWKGNDDSVSGYKKQFQLFTLRRMYMKKSVLKKPIYFAGNPSVAGRCSGVGYAVELNDDERLIRFFVNVKITQN